MGWITSRVWPLRQSDEHMAVPLKCTSAGVHVAHTLPAFVRSPRATLTFRLSSKSTSPFPQSGVTEESPSAPRKRAYRVFNTSSRDTKTVFFIGTHKPMVVRQRCPTLCVHLSLAMDTCGGLTQKPHGQKTSLCFQKDADSHCCGVERSNLLLRTCASRLSSL